MMDLCLCFLLKPLHVSTWIPTTLFDKTYKVVPNYQENDTKMTTQMEIESSKTKKLPTMNYKNDQQIQETDASVKKFESFFFLKIGSDL